MPSFTIEEVAEIVQREGLGYAVWTYMSANAIADRELARRWDNARLAIQEIESFLRKNTSPEEDEELPLEKDVLCGNEGIDSVG